MVRKQQIILVAAVLVIVGSAFSTRVPVAAAEVATPTLVSGTIFEVTRALRQQLQAKIDAETLKPHKPIVVTSSNPPLTLTLALYNEAAGTAEFVTVKKSGTIITAPKDSSHRFKLKRNNGANSEFEVVGEPSVHVVALTYPILTSIGTTRYPKYRVSNVAYVPYSDYLNRPEIVAAGVAYLTANVQSVYDELRALGVHSRAFPERLLADAITPSVVRAIIAIEHVSAQAFLADSSSYLNTFYVVLATNQNQAYAYARSTASARGLVQFIPSTYKMLVKLRPDLGLNPNFEQGMEDPYNAIKAEIGLLDANLAALPASVRAKYADNDAAIGAYLAAIYNGGSSRVLRSIKQWGDDWALDHTKALAQLASTLAQAKADVKATTRQLNATGLTKVARAALVAKQKSLQATVASLTNNQTLGKKAFLARETVQYVAKFKLAYSHFTIATLQPTLEVTNP